MEPCLLKSLVIETARGFAPNSNFVMHERKPHEPEEISCSYSHDNYSSMTGEQAESYIRKRAEVEQSIMQLRLKYIPAFRKVLSGRETALFYQLDWRLGLAIDMQLAQVPLINP